MLDRLYRELGIVGLVWCLVFAFPVVAQLGIRMTPAIARATDLRFRVMFIVLSPLWGRAARHKSLEHEDARKI